MIGRKLKRRLSLLAAGAILLAGCAASPVSQQGSGQNGGTAAGAGALHMITDDVGFMQGLTSRGYYYCDAIYIGGDAPIFRMNFIDLEAQKGAILCSQPSCQHVDASCPAVIPRQAQAFEVGSSLYLYYREMPGDDAEALARIERISYDGAERETVLTFDKSADIFGRGAAADDQKLYTIETEVHDDGAAAGGWYSYQNLVSIDPSTGRREILENMTQDSHMISAYGENLIIVQYEYDDHYEAKGTKCRLLEHSLSTGEEREILSWYENEKMCVINGARCVQLDIESRSLVVVDLAAQTQTTAVEQLEELPVVCLGVYGDILLCGYPPATEYGDFVYKTISLKTGALAEYTRCYTAAGGGGEAACLPVFEWEGSILTVTGETASTVVARDASGQPATAAIQEYEYSLIPCEAFWGGTSADPAWRIEKIN